MPRSSPRLPERSLASEPSQKPAGVPNCGLLQLGRTLPQLLAVRPNAHVEPVLGFAALDFQGVDLAPDEASPVALDDIALKAADYVGADQRRVQGVGIDNQIRIQQSQ